MNKTKVKKLSIENFRFFLCRVNRNVDLSETSLATDDDLLLHRVSHQYEHFFQVVIVKGKGIAFPHFISDKWFPSYPQRCEMIYYVCLTIHIN